MNRTSAFVGLRCRACGHGVAHPASAHRCPECGGVLEGEYDTAGGTLEGETGRVENQYRYDGVLPVSREEAVTMDEGATPLVACPTLARELDVPRVVCKDEGANPTGAVTDRGLSVAVSAARQAVATTVGLPTTGTAGRSAAAYAARAGLDSTAFVPSRSSFPDKAMVNVHGGEMSVVEGRYGDARDAFRATRDPDWFDVGPGSPYRREGAKTVGLELLETGEGAAPDVVVVPTGHGILPAGIRAGIAAAELDGHTPRIVVVQPSGCAPVVEAWTTSGRVDPVAEPDTIVGSLEVPDPAVGSLALDAIEETGGRALSVPDEAALAGAVDVAGTDGLELGVAGGVAVAGARRLAEAGELDGEETVAILNPVAGGTSADLLRSYLMSQGR